MIKTIDMLLYEYRDYSNIYNKIALEEKNNNLIKLKRGLYDTNKDHFKILCLIIYRRKDLSQHLTNQPRDPRAQDRSLPSARTAPRRTKMN